MVGSAGHKSSMLHRAVNVRPTVFSRRWWHGGLFKLCENSSVPAVTAQPQSDSPDEHSPFHFKTHWYAVSHTERLIDISKHDVHDLECAKYCGSNKTLYHSPMTFYLF